MMRTSAPIRVSLTKQALPAQQVRANTLHPHVLPLLSILLSGCEGRDIGFLATVVISLIGIGYGVFKIIGKEDALKAKEMERDLSAGNEANRSRLIRQQIEREQINISRIQNEDILLHCLRQGKKVIVYCGFKPEHLPEIGEEYARPYGGSAEQQAMIMEKYPIIKLLEEIRELSFPTSPSRLRSVFATTSAAEAKEYGEVYELEISLRPEASDSKRLPVRWLDRNIFDHIQGFSPYSLNVTMPYLLECSEEYWSSRGSHEGVSDIIIDPELVMIRVKGRA